eukprot:IDg14922t1
MTEYGVHLANISARAQKEYFDLERELFQQTLRPFIKALLIGRKLLNLESIYQRLRRLREKLLSRLALEEIPELQWAQKAFSLAQNQRPSMSNEAEWKQADEHKFRRVFLPDKQKLCPALLLPKYIHRELELQ